MKIHDVIQGTPEWHNLRAQYFTASEVGPFVYNSGKVAEKARYGIICAKLGSVTGEVEPEWDTYATKRGKEIEPLARASYEQQTGYGVDTAGFCSHDTRMIGCSPDGLVGEDGLLEIKCKLPKAHIMMILDGEMPDEHLCQIHHQLIVTGRAWCDFYAYCPKLPPLLLRTHRSRFTDELDIGLMELERMFHAMKSQLAALWDKAFKPETTP